MSVQCSGAITKVNKMPGFIRKKKKIESKTETLICHWYKPMVILHLEMLHSVPMFPFQEG